MSALRTDRHRISASMMAYAACMEKEIEELRSFRSWAVPKITSQEIERIEVRRQLEEMADTVAVISAFVGSGVSLETGFHRRGDRESTKVSTPEGMLVSKTESTAQ